MSIEPLTWISVVILLLARPVVSNAPVGSGRTRGGHNIQHEELNMIIQLAQLKKRILNNLNMTAAPASDLRDLERPQPQSTPRPGNQTPLKIILAEAADDDQRMDTVSFNLDSHVRKDIMNIESARLRLRLRSTRGSLRSQGSKNNDEQMNRKRRREQNKARKGKTTTNGVDTSKNPLNITMDSATSDKENSNPPRDRPGRRGRKKGRRVRNLKGWRVKIVVRIVNEATGQKQRIAVEKLRVRKNSMMIVRVPKDLLVAAASSEKHSLTVQVTCKRCKRRVRLEQVYKGRRRKRGRRLNPNRPELLIKTYPTAASDPPRPRFMIQDNNNYIAHKRSKRHLCIYCALGLYKKNKTVSPSGKNNCCTDNTL